MPSYLSEQSKFATNSPISFILILNVKAKEDLKIYFWGKKLFCSRYYSRYTTNQSYAPNTPLTKALTLLRKTIKK